MIELSSARSLVIGEVDSPIDPGMAAAVEASVAQYEFDARIARKYPTIDLDTALKTTQLESDRKINDAEWISEDGVIPVEVMELRELADSISAKPFVITEMPQDSERSNQETIPQPARSFGRVDLLMGATLLAVINSQMGWVK